MSHPFIPVIAEGASRPTVHSNFGLRGVLVRLTFASGGSIERKYVLLDSDADGSLTRKYAIGDLLAMHATGYIDSLDVEPADHLIDLDGFDPIVTVHVENVRIAR